jgi:hypothetical protein
MISSAPAPHSRGAGLESRFSFCLSMISSENRYTLFRIML